MKHRSFLMLVAGAMLAVGGPASAQLIAPVGVEFLQGFKAFLYRGLTLSHAEEVAAGVSDPFVYVEVGGGTLPVCYYHFPVKKDSLQLFADAIQLPAGLALAPIAIVTNTAARHYLSVAVYEVAGERNGRIAEWTTYVTAAGDERPRVLMLETATSEGSLDPVRLHAAPAERFDYERRGGLLSTEIVSGSSAFSASIRLPVRPSTARLLNPGWGAARDVLYWRNGVADLYNVNGLIANRRITRIIDSQVAVVDRSPWATFVEARPEWVLLHNERIDAAIRPWVNADDPTLPLDPVFRQELLDTKASAFSAIEVERADAIAAGIAEPMADFLLEASPPAIFLDFEVLPARRAELAAAIPLPAGFVLAPIEPFEGAGKRYLLSLNIYLASGLAPGFRAEWSVYVMKAGDPNPRFMIVEAQTSGTSIDPVAIIAKPADVFDYVSDAGTLSIDIRASGTSFQASILVPDDPERRGMNLAWAECNNLVYWRNGVADKIYYNETSYGPVALVPRRNVRISDGTRWSKYVRLAHIFLYDQPQVFVASPWNNLNQLPGISLRGTPR